MEYWKYIFVHTDIQQSKINTSYSLYLIMGFSPVCLHAVVKFQKNTKMIQKVWL